MIKIPKKIAFGLLVLNTVLLAVTITEMDWNVLFSGKENFEVIFKEIREPLVFLLLTIYFIIYYVGTLKKEEKKYPK